MILRNIYLVFCFIFVVSQNVDDNVCYRGVQPKLDMLIELYKRKPSVSNVPNFPEIDALNDEVENIIFNIMKLEETFNESQAIPNIINNHPINVEDLKNALNTLKLIKLELDDLSRKKDIHNESYNTCSQSYEEYRKLREDVLDIKNTGNAIKAAIEKILKQTEDINAKSELIKIDLDAINIPVTIFHQYLCDSNLKSRIESLLDSIRDISDVLRRKFKGNIENKLREIQNNNTATEKDISEINNSLNQEIPTTNIKITNETDPTVEELKNQLKHLKDKLGNMTLDQPNYDFLRSVEEKFKNLVIEYETILKQLFSKENLDKVKAELEAAQKTLLLLEERDDLKTELDDVKNYVDTLLEGGVCLKGKVEVET